MVKLILAVLLAAAPVLGQGYVCAEGGGNAGKGAWADEVFGWMVEKGGHGKVVLLGAVKLDEDERPALFTRLGAKSVQSLVVTEENADTQETYDAIASASVVFIRGGAQDRYVRWWKDKKTQRAIVEVWKKGGVVAGTSAGCAVLGEVVYDSLHGSLTAREALADGRHEHLSLTTDFLNLVPGVLFDTHFTERARLARLPLMLAMCAEDLKKEDILGIGVDPRTAVCVGPDGIAQIRGEGTATFLRQTPRTRYERVRGSPPTVTDLSYTQLAAGYRYDLAKRQIVGRSDGVAARADAAAPTISAHARSLSGGDPQWSQLGAFRVVKAEPDAWVHGPVPIEPAQGTVGFAIVVPRAFTDQPGDSMAGAQGCLVEHPGLVAAWLDEDSTASVRLGGNIACGKGNHSIMVLDATDPAILAGHGPAPRRAPIIEGAKLSVLGPGWTYNVPVGTAQEVKPEAPTPPENR